MQEKDGICYLCRMLHSNISAKRTQEHHAVYGMGRRKLSERYGLKVYLCLRHHTEGSEAVHRNAAVDRLVKKEAQKAFMRRWPELDFRKIFGKNYLEENEKWQQDKGKAGKWQQDSGKEEQGFRFLNTEDE